MDWSKQQDAALKAVAEWLKRPEQQVFRLFGYAGTGKTTLARHVAEGIRGDVAYGAFTGKAALVMRSKGCEGASTIHSLIYRPKRKSAEEEDEEESFSFAINRESMASKARLIVIDECSMVDEDLGRDLLSFGKKTLVLGDPAQLPPVKGGGYFTETEPDVMLTEVHRQAAGNPIVRMSMDIREGRTLDRIMAIAAVDAQLAGVQGVAVGNRLRGRIANIGSLGRSGIIDNADTDWRS